MSRIRASLQWRQCSYLALSRLAGPHYGTKRQLRACLATTVPFRSPIQMAPFLPFQSGEEVVFTAETVAQQNGTIVAKQALKFMGTAAAREPATISP